MSRRRQLWKLARTGLSALIGLLLRLESRVRQLERQVQTLKGRLALTSRNSGKPPSTDGLSKPAPKSLRQNVSGHSKPARDGRMKTSHFESGIAQEAAKAAIMRDEPTLCEPATFN